MFDMQGPSFKKPHGPEWCWACNRTESDGGKRVILVYGFQLPGPDQRPVMRTEDLPLDPYADPREEMQAVADRIVDEDSLLP